MFNAQQIKEILYNIYLVAAAAWLYKFFEYRM